MKLFKELLPFIIPLVILALLLLWVSGHTTDSIGSVDKTAAAHVDSVSVNNLEDSVVFPDPCTLSFIDCSSQTGVLQLEADGVVPTDSPVLLEVSAYSAKDSCHYENCIMANGLPAEIGYIACPRTIPLGTMVEIDTLGTFECGDRTAKWVDGRYDVFMGYSEEAYNEAIEFGVKLLKINQL